MTKLQAEIIIALADNQINVTKTANKLFMHRTSVAYHIRQIRKNTGKNPMDFYDMCELLPIAREKLDGISARTRNALNLLGINSHGA